MFANVIDGLSRTRPCHGSRRRQASVATSRAHPMSQCIATSEQLLKRTQLRKDNRKENEGSIAAAQRDINLDYSPNSGNSRPFVKLNAGPNRKARAYVTRYSGWPRTCQIFDQQYRVQRVQPQPGEADEPSRTTLRSRKNSMSSPFYESRLSRQSYETSLFFLSCMFCAF